jgi:Gametolysin peptidase M11
MVTSYHATTCAFVFFVLVLSSRHRAAAAVGAMSIVNVTGILTSVHLDPPVASDVTPNDTPPAWVHIPGGEGDEEYWLSVLPASKGSQNATASRRRIRLLNGATQLREMARIPQGSYVVVWGTRDSGAPQRSGYPPDQDRMFVDRFEVVFETLPSPRVERAPAELSVAFLLLAFGEAGEPAASEADFRRFLFSSVPADYSLASWFRRCSWGATRLSEAKSRVVAVRLEARDLSVVGCDYTRWKDEATAAARIDVVTHPFVVVVLPTEVDCPWAGLANVGCYPQMACNTWVKGYSATHTTIQAHELGHNLGLGHARGPDGSEYGDLSGAMSMGSSHRCFGAANAHSLGWGKPTFELVSGDLLGSPRAFLIPSRTTAGGYLRLAKDWWNSSPTGDYFVSYVADSRPAAADGADEGIFEDYLGVLLVHQRTEAGSTQLLATLHEAETYFADERLRITHVANVDAAGRKGGMRGAVARMCFARLDGGGDTGCPP